MFFFNIFAVTIILFAATTFADFNQSEPRIILGTPARLGQIPYQVSIQLRQNNFAFCGGSLIDKKHVVTAAHCVQNLGKKDKIQVWAGSLTLHNGGTYKRVKNIFIHEKYNSNNQDNDIAVLRLEESFTFDSNTHSIALPSGNISDGTNCTVSGWGDTQSSRINSRKKLLYAPVQIHNWDSCFKRYYYLNRNLTKNMICAGDESGHDSCQGDSGGPLVCSSNPTQNKTSLVGIVSFGVGCGRPLFPGVYTNVYPFVDWIKKQQKRNFAISVTFNSVHPIAILISTILYATLF